MPNIYGMNISFSKVRVAACPQFPFLETSRAFRCAFLELLMVASLRLLIVIFGACLLGLNYAAAAIPACSPIVPAPTLYVGDTSRDSKCDWNTIQDAIDHLPCQGAKIVITNEHAWKIPLTIADRTLTLIGSNDSNNCGAGLAGDGVPPASGAVVTIDGAQETTVSVLTITGTSNVTLRYLGITGGNCQTCAGGGIFFGGAGSLTLDNTTVIGNKGDIGGGINMGPSGNATLALLANSHIIGNSATFAGSGYGGGGGIFIEGNTHLIMVADQTQVISNKAANGYGGGILVMGPAIADIGSPGDNSHGADTAGVVTNNSAAHGGGIALIASSIYPNQDAVLDLFTTVAARPVNVQGNVATINGGAFYLKPYQDSFGARSAASMCAFNFRIEHNAANEGAAIYLDSPSPSSGAVVNGLADLNDPNEAYCSNAVGAGFGAVACAADAPCNEVSDNTAQDIHFNPTSGATIFVSKDTGVIARNVSLRYNRAGQLIHSVGASDSILNTTLIADNQVTQQLILGESADFDFGNSTFAHNTIGADHVFKLDANSYLTMYRSIVYQPGKPTVDYAGSGGLNIDDVLSNDITTLPVHAGTVVSGDPLFVNVATGDYRLRAYRQNGNIAASPAIDFVASADTGLDLDGDAYNQPLPALGRSATPRDLGAYEAQPIPDRVFGDAFGDPVSLVH